MYLPFNAKKDYYMYMYMYCSYTTSYYLKGECSGSKISLCRVRAGPYEVDS